MTKLVDIAAELRHETDKAYLLFDGSKNIDGTNRVEWVPKSQVEANGDGTLRCLNGWLRKRDLFNAT